MQRSLAQPGSGADRGITLYMLECGGPAAAAARAVVHLGGETCLVLPTDCTVQNSEISV
jgi:hypothetical protein